MTSMLRGSPINQELLPTGSSGTLCSSSGEGVDSVVALTGDERMLDCFATAFSGLGPIYEFWRTRSSLSNRSPIAKPEILRDTLLSGSRLAPELALVS
jgi:hypothetical protein